MNCGRTTFHLTNTQRKANLTNGEKMKELMDSFINNSTSALLEYFDKYKNKKLMKREDYKRLHNQIHEIFNKYPDIQKFIEDEQLMDFTEKEKKMELNFLDLQEDIGTLELIEAFNWDKKKCLILIKKNKNNLDREA